MSFTKFDFSKRWTNSSDFPTIETDENKVRADQQFLHDETRDALNRFIDEVDESLTPLTDMFAGREAVVENLGTDHRTIPTSGAVNNALKVAGNLPTGGNKGAVLRKASDENFDTTWGDAFAVGDVRITARADLGENWLLCAGEEIPEQEYPELYEMYREQLCTPYEISDKGTISNFVYENGFWIASGSTGRLWFTDDPMKEWSTNQVTTGTVTIVDVKYADGLWVALGDGGTYSYCYAATALDGEWAQVAQLSTKERDALGLAYANGTWCAYCRYQPSSGPGYKCAYSTVDPTGTWAENVWTDSGYYGKPCYFNGSWVYYSIRTGALKIYTSSHPASEVVENSYITDLAITGDGRNHFIEADGMLALLVFASGPAYVLTTTDPAGEWTVHTITFPDGGLNWSNASIGYHNGKWYFVGMYSSGSTVSTFKSRVYCADSLSGEWTVLYSSDGSSPRFFSIGFWGEDNTFVVGDASSKTYISRTGAWLPVLEHEKLNTYIKARE